jgi:hypothetical protein
MVSLEAPYPLLQTTTLLPNPEFSDSEALTTEVKEHRSMIGTLYTYVKTKNNKRKLLMQFKLNRMKGLELRAFIRSYYLSKIRLTDHLEQVWVVNFISNPFEFDTSSDERQNISLEFEGIQE